MCCVVDGACVLGACARGCLRPDPPALPAAGLAARRPCTQHSPATTNSPPPPPPLQGVHKILKKHDKLLPHSPCRQFYIAHLHQQPWVQGTYSDVLVQVRSAADGAADACG